MSPAKLEKQLLQSTLKAIIYLRAKTAQFEAKGEVITFDGFLRVYGGNKDALPKLQSGDEVNSHDMARQTFSPDRQPATIEGSLAKKPRSLESVVRQLRHDYWHYSNSRGYVERVTAISATDVIVLEL